MKLRNWKTVRPNAILPTARDTWRSGLWSFHHRHVVKLGLLAVFCVVGPVAAQDIGVLGSVPRSRVSVVLSLLPPENATGNCVKVAQRIPVGIDFDRPPGQEFNAEGLLKPDLSVEPDVRVR